MTLAVVVATEPAGGTATAGPLPAAELELPGGTVLDRLLDQLAALDVRETHVICRPEHAAVLRRDDRAVVESPGLAGDLRAIARLVRQARRAHGPEPVLVVHGDVIAHAEVLLRVATDDRADASAVIAPGRPNGETPVRPLVRLQRGRVLSAGSPYHTVTDPNAQFRGVLRVAAGRTRTFAAVADQVADMVDGDPPEVPPLRYVRHDPAEIEADIRAAADTTTADEAADARDAGRAAGAAERAAAVAPEPVPDGAMATAAAGGGRGGTGLAVPTDGGPAGSESGWGLGSTAPIGADAPALLLVGMVRSGLRVRVRGVRVLVCERVLTAGQAHVAQAAVDAVDEDHQRLVAAVKGNDGFFTTYAVSTYSRYIARWSARRGLTPNMVTSISMAVSVLAALWFADGSRPAMVLGAVLLYFAFVLDCVDGQLARYSRQFSTLGAWLDATFDRAKEYVCYAGLAVGASAAGVGEVWGLAIAAMGLQTVRHMVDFSFGAAKRRKTPDEVQVLALADPDDRVLDPPPEPAEPARGASDLAIWLSGRSERLTVFRWAKKIIVLPIGERFALISITAALFDARVTFLALIAWGTVAGCYTVTGRVLRSMAR